MIYSNNKKVKHDYEIIETFEAGVVLSGPQVKSIRKGSLSLKGSYVSLDDGVLSLKQYSLARPDYLDAFSSFDDKPIKFLLKKREIKKLQKKIQEKGLTLSITKVYQPENTRFIKAELVLVRGKKLYDKREDLKKKTQEMDMKKAIKYDR